MPFTVAGDPWSSKNAAAALAALEDGEPPKCTFSGGEVDPAPPANGGFAVDAADADPEEVTGALATCLGTAAKRLVSLKLASCELGDAGISQIIVASAPWKFIRELNLQDSGINSFPSIDAAPALLSLDLSFNSLGQLHYPSGGVHRKLLVLQMDDCEIEELSAVVGQRLPALQTLSLADNSLEKLEALAQLKECKALLTLNAQSNDLCDEKDYPKQLRAWCPSLKKVDLTFLNETASASNDLSGRSAHLQSTRNNTSAGVLDAQTDNSTCSCVEGNPCASNDHCYATVKQLIALGLAKKDPAVDPNMRVSIAGRKEEVAKAARRKKGIRD